MILFIILIIPHLTFCFVKIDHDYGKIKNRCGLNFIVNELNFIGNK